MSHLQQEKKIMNINVDKLIESFSDNYKAVIKTKDQINSFLEKHNYKDGMDAEYFLHLLVMLEDEVGSIIKESNPDFDKDKFQNKIMKKIGWMK
jgi:hypothetical protein|tara:strand:- start:319 stop:600 length:282 start_codon:yes stop_codon:yes gene_type:complete